MGLPAAPQNELYPKEPTPQRSRRRKPVAPGGDALAPQWPDRPIGLSSRRLVALLDLRDETFERDAAAADSICSSAGASPSSSAAWGSTCAAASAARSGASRISSAA